MMGLEGFLTLDFTIAIQVIVLGFIGGVLSGFIGSGGAFFMTPGMMNLGVPGIIAVGTNITHKFGKALMIAICWGAKSAESQHLREPDLTRLQSVF